MTLDGRPVVDLWAGERNDAGDPWERDTIVNVYSTTKTMAATVMLMLVDQGQVDIEAPVAEYWPEFKANGKGGVLVRHVLGHTAGVPGFDPAIATETLYDWDACCENLANAGAVVEPGTQSGYRADSGIYRGRDRTPGHRSHHRVLLCAGGRRAARRRLGSVCRLRRMTASPTSSRRQRRRSTTWRPTPSRSPSGP